MEAFVYKDTEGNMYRSGHVDIHHPIPRSKMRAKNERKFINEVKGLHFPMVKLWHNDGKESLHANVPLAPKPDRDLMYIIRECAYGQPPEASPYDVFFAINDCLHDISDNHRNIGLAVGANRLARNFDLQVPFILKGMVQKLEVPDGRVA